MTGASVSHRPTPPPGSPLRRIDLILAAFDADHPCLSLAGLIARTGLPKTTVHRLTASMLAVGWLVRRDGRYHLGDRLFEIAAPCRINTGLRAPARPFLQELASATQETVHLAVLAGTDVLYADKIDGRRPVTAPSRIGGRLPAHCTAIGKILVACSGEAPRERVLAGQLGARTAATIVEPLQLAAEFHRVSAAGVALDREETETGLACIAAPIIVGDHCVAAVSVSAPARRLALKQAVMPLYRAVAQIAAQLNPRSSATAATLQPSTIRP